MSGLIELWRTIHRRLDQLQRRRAIQIVALVIIAIASSLTWGRLLLLSKSLADQRSSLVSALAGKNRDKGDAIALELAETGLVTVNGITYGDAFLIEQADLLFSPEGEIERPEGLAELMVRDKIPAWAPRWLVEQPRTTGLLAAATTGLLVLVVTSASVLGFLLAVFLAVAGWGLVRLFGGGDVALAPVAMSLLVFSYLLLAKVVMGLLSPSHRVLAVAHTVMKEATRTGIPLVFVIGLLIVLPLLPFGLDPDSPLRYRIQSFISRSVGISFYAAAFMTLFLACATVAFEIRDRQIWQVVSKPIGRAGYLFGKWVGIIAVNVVVLAVASLSIFTFVQYQRQLPVAPGIQGLEDLQQIRDSVLTARVGVRPVYEPLTPEQVRERIEARIERDPDLANLEQIPLEFKRRVGAEVMAEHLRLLRQVPPQQYRTFRFSGLDTNFDPDEMITLRYRFHIMRDDEHRTYPAFFRFNESDNFILKRTYVPTLAHTVTIPAGIVQPDGTLTVEVANMYEGMRLPNGRILGEVNWDLDGFEILYRVGSFEGNFARAMVVNLVKLSFLAMLGIACGTFLNFPVACLTAFTVFMAGIMGPFLARSLEYYGPVPFGMLDWSWANTGMIIQWFFQSAIKVTAETTVFMLESFGRVRPADALVNGRLISWRAVAEDLIRIGVLWSGLVLLAGWAVMRRRQLAIYSGQG